MGLVEHLPVMFATPSKKNITPARKICSTLSKTMKFCNDQGSWVFKYKGQGFLSIQLFKVKGGGVAIVKQILVILLNQLILKFIFSPF